MATLLTTTLPSLAAERAAGDSDPLAANAALHYWQAFAAMPKSEEKTDKAMMEAVEKVLPVEGALVELAKKSEYALRELHRGARQPRCVWGYSREEGFGLLLPQLQQARYLARLASLHAQWDVQQGRNDEAIEHLVDVMTLARHVGQNGVLVCNLVDYAIEKRAIMTAAALLPRLDAAQRDRLRRKFAAIPPTESPVQVVTNEIHFGVRSTLERSLQPGGYEFAQQVVSDSKMSQEELRIAATGLLPICDQLPRIWSLPRTEIAKAQKELLARQEAPVRRLAELVLFQPDGILVAMNRQQTLVALFRAAIAVQDKGAAVLSQDDLKNPVTGAPFTYEKTAAGFRLVSNTLDRDGKPTVLEVGH